MVRYITTYTKYSLVQFSAVTYQKAITFLYFLLQVK